MLSISSKKLFSFKIFKFLYFQLLLTQLFPVNHWLRGWFKIKLNVDDVRFCLNKDLITHFVWYLEKEKRYDIETLPIDRVLCKEDFHAEIMHWKPVQDLFLILVNNPKQPLHARNCFKNKIFWKRIIKKP